MKLIDQALRFLAMADRDIKAFEVLQSDPEVSLVSVCFHAQQAVEKSLKAVLILHGIEFGKTHDLNALTLLLMNNKIDPPLSPEELDRLTPFAVTFRYEDREIETVNRQEAQKMVEAIRNWSGERVKSCP